MSKKFYFVANLIVGSVGLTFSLMSWFMTDFYNGLHLLMTISSTASLAYALSMYDSFVDLTNEECDNLLDALTEWFAMVGPKELDDNEEGLNEERYQALVSKLK